MLTLKYDRIMPADTLGMAKLFVGAAMPHEDIPDIQEFIKDMERTGRLKDAIEKGRKQYGMQSFDQHLSEMYQNKIITLDTARQASTNPNDFERALHFE
jgi:Tfp pilus assembly pilus retraction ATPase PilT